MTDKRSDAMAALRAADPAADVVADAAGRDQVWRILAGGVSGATRRRAARSSASRLARVSVPIFAFTLLVVAAALASGLIKVGSPVKRVEGFQISDAGLGSVTPGSERVLSLRASDPQGGAPWGLRVFATTRGAGCVQAGRVVEGQFGALGADGAFADDGQLHPLPAAGSDELSCSALDAAGGVFESISKGDELANGLIGPETAPTRQAPAHDVCAAAAATSAEQSAAQGRICPQSQERDLFFGLLGPQAQSVTYLEGARRVTIPTSGPEGAYLIVQDAPSGWQPIDTYGAGQTGPLPIDSPIVEIHYASGAICHPADSGDPACAPTGVPAGYVAAEPTPTASRAAATVSSSVLTAADGRKEALVSFDAPLAISSVRDQYRLRWHIGTGGQSVQESLAIGEGDVAAGQPLSVRTGSLPSGATQLEVVLQHASGPALFEGVGTVDVPVGSTNVDIPSAGR